MTRPTRPLISPWAAPLLAAHHWQGESNDCGPYAVAILLRGARGVTTHGREMAQTLNRPRWRGPFPLIRRIPHWATFPWGVVDALRTYGIPATWMMGTPFRYLYAGLRRGWALLPVFGQWRPLWAHVAWLVAYHPRRGWGFVDSAHPRAELVWMSPERFSPRWRAYGNLLVLADPRRVR